MNKRNHSKKHLVLGKESLRHLTIAELGGVLGGAINQSRGTQCECPTALGCGGGDISEVNTACTK